MSLHVPVLLKESIDGLDLNEFDVVLDGTLGSGGHSHAIAEKLGIGGVLVALDQDEDAIERSRKKLADTKCELHLVRENFRNLDKVLENLDIKKIDKILLDLGWSTDQMEDKERGMSYREDGPLQMTLLVNPDEQTLTAYEIVNEWGEDSLVDILKGYGEERYAKGIARGIVSAREEKKIETTLELVEIIENSVPKKYIHGKTHFAARTFQALRIAVNDELGALRDALEVGFEKLGGGGRLAIISFHSLEDRIVKNFFRDKKNEGLAELLTKKPIVASREELAENNKARSAKLRILKKL